MEEMRRRHDQASPNITITTTTTPQMPSGRTSSQSPSSSVNPRNDSSVQGVPRHIELLLDCCGFSFGVHRELSVRHRFVV